MFAAFMQGQARIAERQAKAEETKARAYHEAAKERTMDNFILTYGPVENNTHNKIKAIKAVRMIFGTDLKDAKDIVEGNGRFEDGIIVSKLQTFAINGVYIKAFSDAIEKAFALSDAIEGERFHDFTFEPIPAVLYREDFTDATPLGDPSVS